MNIAAVRFKNFKGFEGNCLIDGLDAGLSSKRNVVLFGGYNGAGKTTFLEGLYMCFYGVLAVKLYPSKGAKLENYRSYVCSLVNNNLKAKGRGGVAEMEIEVKISDVKLTGNIPRNISLIRKWVISNHGIDSDIISEDFDIFENGKPIEELDKSEFQDRVNALLPYSVAQFFFFDGEKIEDFAADADGEFAISLKDVLGINLYSTLSDDLRQVRQRILTDYNKNKEVELNLLNRRADLLLLEGKQETNIQAIADLNAELGAKQVDREKLQATTSRLTRISSDSRTNIQVEKGKLENEKEALIRDYVETSKDYIPFILASDLSDELDKQLDREQEYQDWLSAQKQIEPKLDRIINSVFDDNPSPPRPDITFVQKDFYRRKIERVIKQEVFNADENLYRGFQPIHNLSSADSLKIKRLLSSIDQSIITVLHRKSQDLKAIDIRLERIRQTEVKAGDNKEDIQGFFDQISKLGEDIGRIKQEIEQVQQDIEKNNRLAESLKREITNWEDKIKIQGKKKAQIEYCEKYQRVIEEFQKQFQALRTDELQEAILDMWNMLAQKERQVGSIKIYPERNFEVKLFDDWDNEIDKTKLSAGEKEIFAISLLSALVKVSGKDLPIVIDTPFGRLDSKHRTNIVKKYFPNASHQVILLSQDEEVVGEYYKVLKPNISREFAITYNNKKRQSLVTEGYPFSN
jgi:DNA sulfur modification protein DndD